jgi:hypothetical protein
MPFDRIGSSEGPLTGVLRAGGAVRGVEKLNGRLATGSLLGAAPIDSLEFRETTILFLEGRCEEARGVLTAKLALRLGPIDLDRGFTGPLTCEGERVRARLASPGGGERVEFFVSRNGQVRGWISIRSPFPGLDAILGSYGFRNGPDGLTLPFQTRL